jgi:hypothetical protein
MIACALLLVTFKSMIPCSVANSGVPFDTQKGVACILKVKKLHCRVLPG